MPNWTRERIIEAYNAYVAEHGGRPVGIRVFLQASGIPMHHFKGGHWRSWSDFQAAAGHAPNAPTPRTSDDEVLRRYAELAVERGQLPTLADLRLKRKSDATFPGENAFARWGDKNALLTKLADYCKVTPDFATVGDMLSKSISTTADLRLTAKVVTGFVYLLRSGRNYKLGRSNAVGRRLRELAIQLPERPDTVHVIETDDPEGIEQYWHRRYADKRRGGEWFVLSAEDVAAFKRRKYQ